MRKLLVFAFAILWLAGNAFAADLPFHLLSAATTNSTLVKSGAGQLSEIVAINTTATVYDLRFYDSNVAPTCSSTTGVVWNVPVPANTSGGGVVIPIPAGVRFSSGIGFCLTGAVADNDNTNAAAGIAINLSFK